MPNHEAKKAQEIIRASGDCFNSNSISKFQNGRIKTNEAQSVDDTFVRSIGFYDQKIKSYSTDIRNPLKWFQQGIKFLISLPFRIFNWLGIINDQTLNKIITGWFFKFLYIVIGCIGFLSSVITIFTGWASFTLIIKEIIKLKK